MVTKTTGAEFKRFYSDTEYWPDDDGNTFHEDEIVFVNGGEHDGEYENMPDDALVTVVAGIVYSPKFDCNEPSFEAYFKRWRKAQSSISIVVEIDRSKEEALRAAIKTIGGRILK